MMIRRVAVLSMFLFSTALLCLAQNVRYKEEPRTKLEALAAKEDVLVIKGSTQIGEIKGARGGSIAVVAREAREVGSSNRAAGLSIELVSPSEAQSKYVTYIDYDEAPMLLRAIDYLSKVTPSCTRLDNYQAIYRTPGGLELSIQSIRIGEGVRVSSVDAIGAVRSVFLSPADLAQLKDFVTSAMGKVEGK
jgi:hypothetical protein